MRKVLNGILVGNVPDHKCSSGIMTDGQGVDFETVTVVVSDLVGHDILRAGHYCLA